MLEDLDELSPREVLLRVEANRTERMRAEADQLLLAVHWCGLHGGVDIDERGRARAYGEQLIGVGGDGTPEVEEFAAAEFGAMSHLHPMAARNLMCDALDLRHRLPRVWQATVRDLALESWVARKVARLTHDLDRTGAAYVDEAIAPYLESLPPGRLLALVEAKIIEADPDAEDERRRAHEQSQFVRATRDAHGLSSLVARAATGDVIVLDAMVQRIADILGERGDTDSLNVRRARALGLLGRPAEALRLLVGAAQDAGVADEEVDDAVDPDATLRTTLDRIAPAAFRAPVQLFVHLHQDALAGTASAARIEGQGPILADQLREWLGRSGADLTVTPVLDLAGQTPVDGYEFPARIVEALHQLSPAEPFPWSVNTSRRKDTDHPDPYLPPARGGPPGQTGMHNGARLGRHHHRIKTHGDWRVVQAAPGVYFWRTPHGFWFRVDQDGTYRCDNGRGVISLGSAPAA